MPVAAASRPFGGAAAPRLARLGLHGEADLLLHLPLRYEDETRIVPIAAARIGDHVQIEGIVVDSGVQFRPRRQLVVRMQDDSGGVMVLRFLNFYGSQTKQLALGRRLRARGEVRDGFLGLEMVHPHYGMVGEETPLPDRLTPVYPAGEGVSQNLLRAMIDRALEQAEARGQLADTLPESLRVRYHLASFGESIRLLHRPTPEISQAALMDRSHPAWLRMKFDELLAQQLSLKRAQTARRERSAPRLNNGGVLVRRLLDLLPFTLTAAQQRVWKEIAADLAVPYPMQRLLQGDVGSGKTVVAALAALQTLDNGYQAALMAPTEILAEQHFRKLSEWVEALGVQVAWLTGSPKKKQKEVVQRAVESGAAQLIIGTHALIQDAVKFPRLGLIIVDEQHRFGVAQRLALRNKAGNGARNHDASAMGSDSDNAVGNRNAEETGNWTPHQLMMSATPIPRTLAMTYYADLEVSTIDELPPGRKPITTKLIEQSRRDEVIARVHDAVRERRQAYWVCPLIDESEALQLQTAMETHATLSIALADLNVGLVHGRLASAEKAETMASFTRGEIDVLVATTVIEVGVDVPNASLMVIEHAERFGLAQLHQLRGRIGRGTADSVCILLYQTPLSQLGKQRLRILRETQDGFEIARRDLELRGPGEFLGQRQSGLALLRFADLQTDQWIVEQAREAAAQLLRDDPQTVERHLARWMGARQDYLKA